MPHVIVQSQQGLLTGGLCKTNIKSSVGRKIINCLTFSLLQCSTICLIPRRSGRSSMMVEQQIRYQAMLWVMVNTHHKKLFEVMSRLQIMMEELVQQLTNKVRQQLVAVTYQVLSRQDKDGQLRMEEMGNNFMRECWQVKRSNNRKLYTNPKKSMKYRILLET